MLCIDHSWLHVGKMGAECEEGPRAHISRWTVIFKENTACSFVCFQFYKSE